MKLMENRELHVSESKDIVAKVGKDVHAICTRRIRHC